MEAAHYLRTRMGCRHPEGCSRCDKDVRNHSLKQKSFPLMPAARGRVATTTGRNRSILLRGGGVEPRSGSRSDLASCGGRRFRLPVFSRASCACRFGRSMVMGCSCGIGRASRPRCSQPVSASVRQRPRCLHGAGPARPPGADGLRSAITLTQVRFGRAGLAPRRAAPPAAQFAISTGRVAWARIWRVVPPKIIWRRRLWV
jgi:hypothetical protein